jgi:uncharacterized protein (DUF58 family)
MAAEAFGTDEVAGRVGAGEVARSLAAFALDGLRAVRRVVRPIAWVLIAGAVVLWTVGQVFGWFELTVAALVIAVALVVCLVFLVGRTAYDVSLDLGRTRVVVGERAVGALTLANRGSRAILPSRVVLPVGSGRGTFAIKRLAPGEEVEELFAIPTHRRGVLKVGPVSVVRGDPLGLFERVHRRDEPADLYVHPRTVLFDGNSLGFLRDLDGLPTTDLSPDDVSFHALREYQPGDDLRHVHWRSTARAGTIMVRQYEETRRSHFVIGLTRHPADYRDADEFELAVSIAGSVGLRGVRDSMQVELSTQGRSVTAETGKRLLDTLTTVELARGRDGGVEALARSIASGLNLASIVVFVVGSSTDAGAIRSACARLPFGSRVLVVCASSGSSPALRRIGDADVITVGSLEQLPTALRRVLA